LSIASQNHIAVPGTPTNMVLAPDCQQVFCALDLASKVVALNSKDGQEKVLEVLNVGSGPQAMAYYQPQNRVFVCNAWDSTVTVIRTEVGVEEPGKPVRPSGPALVRALPSPAPARHTVSFSATALHRPGSMSGTPTAGWFTRQSAGPPGPGRHLQPASISAP